MKATILSLSFASFLLLATGCAHAGHHGHEHGGAGGGCCCRSHGEGSGCKMDKGANKDGGCKDGCEMKSGEKKDLPPAAPVAK